MADTPSVDTLSRGLTQTAIHGFSTCDLNLVEQQKIWPTIFEDFYKHIVKELYTKYIEPLLELTAHERRMIYPELYKQLLPALIRVR